MLRELGAQYGVAVNLTRDSDDAAYRTAYRKLSHKAGRAVPGKTAYKERVRRLLKTARAQKAAANHAKSWRKTCQIVVKRKGGAPGK